MALIDAPRPATPREPVTPPDAAATPDAARPDVANTPPPDVSSSVQSGLLDLEPLLVRSLGLGILGGVLFALVAVAVPLTIARGLPYGLGVGGMVAFWCGIGFGMIAGSAAYVARSGH